MCKVDRKALGYDVFGNFGTCEACSIGKSRLINVKKDWAGGNAIQGMSFGDSKFRALIADDYSGYCRSYFMKHKSELKEKMVELINEFLRLDDVGEKFCFGKVIQVTKFQNKG
jgi:hypothetical protein